MLKTIVENFKEIYGEGHNYVYFAPGRVNLIGEHTDYNGGHVFPCALDIGTYLVVRKREDNLLRFYSKNFSHMGIIETNISDLKKNDLHDWANYPKGVIKTLINAQYAISSGFDLYYFGNIPNGGGLSSSASIELVTAIMLDDMFNLKINRIQLIKYCQQAENSYMGVNCGIMDQFAIGMGKENHAILLNTNNLRYEYVPLNLEGCVLVVSNTNKRRGLADSKYNERRKECEDSVQILKNHINIKSLGDLSIEQFELYSKFLDEPLYKRAKHAVYENQRTLKAKHALNQGDLKLFGQLMNESHISLRDLYEVTGVELDTLVELAWMEEGVIGSRMTGAGFGGCTISIVRKENVQNFKKNIEQSYEEKIGYKPTFYVLNIGDGGRKLI